MHTLNHIQPKIEEYTIFTDSGLVSFLMRFVVKLNGSQCNYNVMVLAVVLVNNSDVSEFE